MPIIDDAYLDSLKTRVKKLEESHKDTNPHKQECKRNKNAFMRIYDFVGVREHSSHEVRSKLSRESYTEDEIELGLAQAIEAGFIDDQRFAEALVNKHIRLGKGRQGIERELDQHAIDPYCLEGWPHEYFNSDEEELERALELLRSKPPRTKNLRESAYRRLIAKGYSSSIATTASRIWVENLDEL